MKKLLPTLLLTAMSLTAGAHEFAAGTYTGKGSWKMLEKKGYYEVQTKVSADRIESVYKYEGMKPDQEVSWNFQMKDTAGGFFDVFSSNVKVGSGYCLEHVTLCHYEVQLKNLKLEESIVLHEGQLYKYGSKVEGGVSAETVRWSEALSPSK